MKKTTTMYNTEDGVFQRIAILNNNCLDSKDKMLSYIYFYELINALQSGLTSFVFSTWNLLMSFDCTKVYSHRYDCFA